VQLGFGHCGYMTKSSALLGALVLISATALADPAVIIRERAKQLSNENNVRQGVVPPTQQPTPSMAVPNVPAGPVVSPALMRFNTEISGIKADGVVTPDQKQKMAQQLIVAAQGSKPSMALATKLATDVSAAFSEKPLSASSRARFVQEPDAMLNPGKYPQAKPEKIIEDIQAIFHENGLARMKAAAIAEDVQKLSAEIRKGGA
jgi:hypothetical protein